VVARYNAARRERIIAAIYAAPDASELCRLAGTNHIDFIEVLDPPFRNPILAETSSRASFSTTADDGRSIRFLDVRQACVAPRPAN
jgi:hypothetical protein